MILATKVVFSNAASSFKARSVANRSSSDFERLSGMYLRVEQENDRIAQTFSFFAYLVGVRSPWRVWKCLTSGRLFGALNPKKDTVRYPQYPVFFVASSRKLVSLFVSERKIVLI